MCIKLDFYNQKLFFFQYICKTLSFFCLFLFSVIEKRYSIQEMNQETKNIPFFRWKIKLKILGTF